MGRDGDKWCAFKYKDRLAWIPRRAETFGKTIMHTQTLPTRRILWLTEIRAMASLAWPLVLAQLAQAAFFTTDVVLMGWRGAESLRPVHLTTPGERGDAKGDGRGCGNRVNTNAFDRRPQR